MGRDAAVLSDDDYAVMGFGNNELAYLEINEIIQNSVPQEYQQRINSVIQRIADINWIRSRVISEMKEEAGNQRGIGDYEGLLSLALYLFLTCAETLGYLYDPTAKNKERFSRFFQSLPPEIQLDLAQSLIVWKTSFDELQLKGLFDQSTGKPILPNSKQQLLLTMQHLSDQQRYDHIVDYLYARRNASTHEAEVPQLGFHPNLSVIMALSLKIPNITTYGYYDRLQTLEVKSNVYICYFEHDPAAPLKWAILQGLGKILRNYNKL